MNEIIKLDDIINIAGLLSAIATLFYKIWTDRKTNEEKLAAELRDKTSKQYLEFLNTVSKFLNNINVLENRQHFLNLCYTMILICDDELKKKIERLLAITLKYSEGVEISSEDDFKSILMDEKLINGIITLMRKNIQNNHNASESSTDWMQAIEFLILEVGNKPLNKPNNDAVSNSLEKYNELPHEPSNDTVIIKNNLERSCWWVNSNAKYSGYNAWKEMIKHGIVCTYGPIEFGNKLKSFKIGDCVYLYLSGAGIIAAGIVNKEYSGSANKIVLTNPQNGEPNEYSVGVDWKLCVEPVSAITPEEIRRIGHALFIHTVMGLNKNKGEALYQLLQARTTGCNTKQVQ